MTAPGVDPIASAPAPTPRPRPVGATAALAALALAATLGAAVVLGACGSSSHANAAVLGSKAQRDCTAVSDVLADGPDPDADTVGYAEAQVLPLSQVKVSSPALRSALRRLDGAYRAYSSSTGAAQDSAAVQTTEAEDAVNAICPGAAP